MTDTTNVLLVCANPRGSEPLRTAEEDRTLRESIQLSANRDHFHIETLNAATVDDLRRALLRERFDVVHFSGHGSTRGLLFEDVSGRLMVPPSDAMAELLARRRVKIALLNACYSLSVGRLSSIGLEYTIASSGPISDPGAIEFTRGFYDALGAGAGADDAYAEGMSAAALKGLQVDSVLLAQGETWQAPDEIDLRDSVSERREEGLAGPDCSVLLGVAVDVSGSMQSSIDNRSDRVQTRFDGVRSSLGEIGQDLKKQIRRRPDLADSFRLFVYGFGLRIGDGVVDLASLAKAAEQIDIDHEIDIRRRRFESQARSNRYSELGNLARQFGFGDIVDSVTETAKDSARREVTGEIARLVLAEAERIGESLLTADEVVDIFDGAPGEPRSSAVEHVLFGATPMSLAARKLAARLRQTEQEGFDYRTLLMISDGEPTDGDPRTDFAEIRSSGVDVVSCFLTDSDVSDPRTLVGRPGPEWPSGARLMWEISSAIDENSAAASYFLSQGWSIEPDARMFVQINHSDVLREFTGLVTQRTAHGTQQLLPQGR